ncbi:MAG TPA: bifunctional riboflavin kinase/FAD synthetase [Nitrospiria bacterium]|nr:bifunctional riboflavin kinase/FAD synthetase [Nitrospiria bacterium]
MRRFIGTEQFEPVPDGVVLTIGNFDGVHLGHQALLKTAVARSRDRRMPSAALTFWPHPLRILSPEKKLKLLSPLDEKLELIEQTGIDILYCADFDRSFSQQSPETFVRSYLVDKIGCRELIVGYNFDFGKNRSGKANDLIEFGRQLGFSVQIREPVEVEGTRVSSSAIRALLADGNVSRATKLLGRRYTLSGKVIEGAKRGSTLGYPTANIAPPADQMIPLSGVYAAWAETAESGPLPAAVYIGSRPTFGEGELLIEAHFLDPVGATGILYGKILSISLCDFIRGDERFDSAEALARQIGIDVQKAKGVLQPEKGT